MKVLCTLVLVGLAALATGEKVRYDGYRVERITPQTEQQLQALRDLEATGVRFWQEPSLVGNAVDILFPPHLQADFLPTLRSSGMKVETFVEDVQSLIESTMTRRKPTRDVRYDLSQYNSLDEIENFLNDIANGGCAAGEASIQVIGKSYESRNMSIIKIKKGTDQKPIIWLDANIHAREWITHATALNFINEICNGERGNYLDFFEFHILPMMNPDGYEHSRTVDRMWRKTRSPGGICKGADANRNFDFHWLGGGSSTNPCSDTYAGDGPFSEVENRNVRDHINSIAARLVSYISLHSYSQYILLPFGHTADRYADYEAYMDLGKRVSTAIESVHGTYFRPGNIVDLLYVASGGSMDWVKGTHNVTQTFTYELRDAGRYGFLLPPEQIKPSAEEFFVGFDEIVDELVTGRLSHEVAARMAKISHKEAKPVVDAAQFESFGHAPIRRGMSPLEALRRH